MIKKFVKKELINAEKGHDYKHAIRVLKYAQIIQNKEGGDLNIIEAAALLHDVADSKFNNEEKQVKKIEDILKENKNEILHIIKNISFRKKYEGKKSLEFQIVQDADILDAIGAIGIARSFNYGGYINLPIHDKKIKINPDINPLQL